MFLYRLVKEKLEKARELGDSLLTNLSLVGESRYGRGLLSHVLLTSSVGDKMKCALALPYAVR